MIWGLESTICLSIGLLLITISIIPGFENMLCIMFCIIGLFIISITWLMFAPGASVPGGPVAIGKLGIPAGAAGATPAAAVPVAAVLAAAGAEALALRPPFTKCRVWPSSTL